MLVQYDGRHFPVTIPAGASEGEAIQVTLLHEARSNHAGMAPVWYVFPTGGRAGDVVQVDIGGREFDVTLPDGVSAGQAFELDGLQEALALSTAEQEAAESEALATAIRLSYAGDVPPGVQETQLDNEWIAARKASEAEAWRRAEQERAEQEQLKRALAESAELQRGLRMVAGLAQASVGSSSTAGNSTVQAEIAALEAEIATLQGGSIANTANTQMAEPKLDAKEDARRAADEEAARVAAIKTAKEQEEAEAQREAEEEAQREAEAAAQRERERKLDNGPQLTLGAIQYDELQIGNMLGSGAYGVVHMALWKGDGVAVKQIRRDRVENRQEAKKAFMAELSLSLMLRHRHIVNCYGGSCDPELVLVMELMERGSLSECLRDHPDEFAWARLGKKILLDAAKGMVYLHSFTPPIVHFDIKPLNVLVSADNTGKLADVGLTRQMMATLTMPQGWTPNYAAPEVLQRLGANEKSDVYSFGVSLLVEP